MSSLAIPLPRSSYITGALWGLFAISIWVGWILLTRYGVTTSLSPFDITALRFGCAGALLLPIVIRDGLGVRRVGLPLLTVICTGAGVPYVLISSAGLQFAPAAQAGALIPGTMPLWAALLATLFLHERIAGPRRAGLLLIPVGIVIFVGTGLTDLASGNWRGQLLFLLAALCWASFTVAMRRAGTKGFTALHATAVVSVVSAAWYLPVYVMLLPHRITAAPWDAVVIQTLYQGVLVAIISLFAYTKAVSILGASLGSSFASLVPVLAMLAAIPLLGEVPKTADYFGIAAVTLGVFLSSGAYGALVKSR
ncbi:DMT family transporter [uncultured Thiodictyon sp.]|jgi:drug/metabolite transporter (DMT)-like permease|uniref:DMT family transporter n=1 Tax=uncultured Thiodictyon sp. TaxID=1846217 RepID=UPI0025F62A9F|nr:DMT family transporter [uncultured Thiodictyon sp.]